MSALKYVILFIDFLSQNSVLDVDVVLKIYSSRMSIIGFCTLKNTKNKLQSFSRFLEVNDQTLPGHGLIDLQVSFLHFAISNLIKEYILITVQLFVNLE